MASCTALSMLPPYGAKSPVNGSTVPIFSVKAQFAPAAPAAPAARAVDAVVASTAASAATTANPAARFIVIELGTRTPSMVGPECCNPDRYFAQAQGLEYARRAMTDQAPAGAPDVGGGSRQRGP